MDTQMGAQGKRLLAIVLLLLPWCILRAQFNTERVMLMGRSALYYEDYVLSIQRFSLVINAKPHLAEPYFFRGLAKFFLEDYSGAETDATSAITRNPYTANYYVLRGTCRVNNKKFSEAEQDYQKAISIDDSNQDHWHNMVLCQIEQNAFQRADSCLDIMIDRWPKNSGNYTIKARLWLIQMEDTVKSEKYVDRALEINAFDGDALSLKSFYLMNREDYKGAEEALTQSIVQFPRQIDLYINRAMSRYKQDNLRGAMTDYDKALEINSKSHTAHFNRGLLRAQVGEDNLAIEDFNIVLENEPDNYIALYNRALLLNNTGNYKAALEDISAILKEYPYFWNGYLLRASIRRKVGDRYGAERDEFKVLKARVEGTLASKQTKSKKTRKESNKNLDDFDKLVEEDTVHYHNLYATEYRGRVQDRDADTHPAKSYVLSYHPRYSMGHETQNYHPAVERFSKQHALLGALCLTNDESKITEQQTAAYFDDITAQTQVIDSYDGKGNMPVNALFQRAIDYFGVRDFESAILDLDVILNDNPSDIIALFLRAQMREALYGKVEELSKESTLELKKAADDLHALFSLDNEFVCALFNEANIFFYLKDYDKAIKLYSQLISIDNHFAEAYYNRGLANIMIGNTETGLADLSQAGEYGLFKAYTLIKKYSKKNINQNIVKN